MAANDRKTRNIAMDKTLYDSKIRDFALWLLILLPVSCGNNTEDIRILLTGDILLSRVAREEYRMRRSSPFEHVQHLFRQADLVVGNLEGAVGETKRTAKYDLTFDIAENDLDILHKAGFHAFIVENNHSQDLGIQGKKHTIQALQKRELVAIHNNNSPQFFDIRGVIIAFVAINTIPNKDSIATKIPSVEIMQQLRLAKTLSNIVIAFVHWGNELSALPNRRQRYMAKWLVAHGADIVVGSHPHVVQPPEQIDGKPVFFSLGNHLFDQKYEATKEGLIADIRIKNGKVNCTGILTHTLQGSFYPAPTGKIEYGLHKIKLRQTLQHNGLALRPVQENDSLGMKIRLQAYHNKKKVWTSVPVSLTSIETAQLDGEKEYLFTLEKHYSDVDDIVALRPYVYAADEKGIRACWRGSVLAYPLIDAHISTIDNKTLCAWHRGDSFILPNPKTTKKRIITYQWNGFGFNAINDTVMYCAGKEYYTKVEN
jgi:poly-gamma-glutamate synthesis protein (capsule biosynthesis protein)